MPPTAVLKTYDNNRIERFTEELEDMKAKLLKSEKENARLTEELEDMKAKLLKSEKENARLTEELEDMKAKLLKSEKENASLIKDFEEKIMPGSSPEGLNDDLVTRERERNSRASPATKEDVQTIIELLSTSLKLPHERQREELTRQK
jgi:chromosome segregation ATPase